MSARVPCPHRRRVFEDDEVLEMRRAVRSGQQKRLALAASLGIGPQHLRHILLGTLYAHVPEALTEEELRPTGVFTDEDVAFWRKKFATRRRRITFTAVAKKHRTQVSAVINMVTGVTYAHLPDAVPREAFARKPFFTDEMVERYRAQYRACQTTKGIIARQRKTSEPTVDRMLRGGTFAHVPGALSDDEMEDRRREFTPSVVLFMRLAYGAPGILIRDVAAVYKITPSTAGDIITGRTYSDVPGATALKTGEPVHNAKLTNPQVLELRRRFKREYPNLTLKMISDEVGIAESNVLRLLKGQSYKDVGEAVPPELFHYGLRSLSPEVALFMRLIYHPERVTCQMLADAYGLNVETVHRLLTGKTYRNIPGALTSDQMRHRGKPRMMTTEAVQQARRQFATRWVTTRALAREVGIGERSMENAIRGYTYKDVPGAIPEHINPLPAARIQMRLHRRRRRPDAAATTKTAA